MKFVSRPVPPEKSVADPAPRRSYPILTVAVVAPLGLVVGMLTAIVANNVSHAASPSALLLSLFFALIVGRATVLGGTLVGGVCLWLGIVLGSAFMPQLQIAHHRGTILALLVSTALVGHVGAAAYKSGRQRER